MIRSGAALSRATTRRSTPSGAPVSRSRLNGRLRSVRPAATLTARVQPGDRQADEDDHFGELLVREGGPVGLRGELADRGGRGRQIGIGELQCGAGPLDRRCRPVRAHEDRLDTDALQALRGDGGGGPGGCGQRVIQPEETGRQDRRGLSPAGQRPSSGIRDSCAHEIRAASTEPNDGRKPIFAAEILIPRGSAWIRATAWTPWMKRSFVSRAWETGADADRPWIWIGSPWP